MFLYGKKRKMMPHLVDLVKQAKIAIEHSHDISELNLIHTKYFGKNGYFSEKIRALREMPIGKRSLAGSIINKAKQEIKQTLVNRKTILKQIVLNNRLVNEILDISLPGRRIKNGGLHPISITTSRIEHLFSKLGFSVVTGLEIEDDYHNFDALNIPIYHPTRTNHDTFWFDTTRLLRTQTSGIQIRVMKSQQLPIRIISSGRVYRNDYDQTHTPMFHQLEGLVVDTNISFTHLKGILYDFLHNFFEENLQIRFRPSYFPFTEPSAEVDIMGKDGHWLEVLGCGMIHPNVFRNVGINSEKNSGFAFGLGIERLTMLSYDITDLRAFFKNDLRFLKQFR